MAIYNTSYLRDAHEKSARHKDELLKSALCGCFYCCNTFEPSEITEWIEDMGRETAICPKCGIDSVLGDEFPVQDHVFLKSMKKIWF